MTLERSAGQREGEEIEGSGAGGWGDRGIGMGAWGYGRVTRRERDMLLPLSCLARSQSGCSHCATAARFSGDIDDRVAARSSGDIRARALNEGKG